MDDAASCAHTTTRNDDRTGPDVIDCFRRIGRATQGEIRQRRHWIHRASEFGRLVVVKVWIIPIYLGCLYRHWAIKKDLPSIDTPFLIVFSEVIKNFLAATDRKCRDKNIAAIATGSSENFL